ncbi:MAG: hypothetical protein K2N64_05340 [Anaeroplasmataceae bacterium]|nr:hypothetical protein [Anaeroplasmataceae bacterium]
MQELVEQLKNLSTEKKSFVIAIDGMAASGKTTLANALSKELDANVIHIDDFFLPISKRTSQIGGNIDFKRIKKEILESVSSDIVYHPFDCTTQTLKDSISLSCKKILIIEGTYSLFPSLGRYYDFSIFKKIEIEEQNQRLYKRDFSKYLQFINLWLPLEQSYFLEYEVEKGCDMIISR